MKMARPKLRPFASFAPLKFFLLYLAATLMLAVWGPVQYFMFPIGKTLLFMAAVMVSIAIGYTYGVEMGVKVAPRRKKVNRDLFIRRLFDISLAISLSALTISIISAILSGSLNTDFSAIGDAYVDVYEGYERNTGNYSLTFILYSISLPFNFIAFIFGFYYFSSFDKIRKGLIVSLAIASLLFYVLGSGKQKQIGDIMIYLFTIVALKYGVRRKPIQLKWMVGGAALAIIGLLAFVIVLGQRYGALGVDASNVNERITSLMFVNFRHPVFYILGDRAGLTVSMFLSYLSQGYYGLGLALETDWQWTHFLGFSYSISVLANRLFGLEWQWPNTLLHQVGLNTGWDESKWHTVFTHFATDFTFPGTVVLFGFFAYVYARSWLSATRFENPFSILFFAQLTMGAFFMPANNQLLHSPGGLFNFITVTFLYLYFGPAYNRPKESWIRLPKRLAGMPLPS